MSATIAAHEAEVHSRFDALHNRFPNLVAEDDARLRALIRGLGPLEEARVLDLGSGKGRYGTHLEARGAEVIGLDLSGAMLAESRLRQRVLGSARSLPFAGETFDAVSAVEVLQHVEPSTVTPILREAKRVLRPGGRLVIVDKNAASLDHNRPWLPALLVKWIDQRRGLWMYPARSIVRERWFWPGALERTLETLGFRDVRLERVLARAEVGRRAFERVPIARRYAVWSARKPGGGDDVE